MLNDWLNNIEHKVTSGKRLHNIWKITIFLIGKLTMNGNFQ